MSRSIRVVVLVLVAFSGACSSLKCKNIDCSYQIGQNYPAYVYWDKINETEKFEVLPNSYIDLKFEVKKAKGPKSGPVFIMFLDDEQLKEVLNDHSKIGSLHKELKKGYTWFQASQGESLSERLYFGQDYDFTIVYYYGPLEGHDSSRDDKVSSNATVVIDFSYSSPVTCMIELGVFIALMVLLAVTAIGGCLLVDFIFRKKKNKGGGVIVDDDFISMEDALGDDDGPTRFTSEEKQFHYFKNLQAQKDGRPWCCRPAGPGALRQPICSALGVKQPRYDLPHYVLFNHEWLSLIMPDPDSPLNRTVKIVLLLTFFFIRVFMLLIWNETFDITDDRIYKNEEETIALNAIKFLPPTILTWIVESVFALAYTWLVVWRLNHPNLCRFGGGSGGVNDDDDYAGDFGDIDLEEKSGNKGLLVARSAINFFLRHILLVVMFIFALAVIVTSLVMLGENVTCEVFGKLIAGVVLVEFFKNVFPGTLFLWLGYWFKNTFGSPPPMENPWDDDDEDIYLAD